MVLVGETTTGNKQRQNIHERNVLGAKRLVALLSRMEILVTASVTGWGFRSVGFIPDRS